MSASGKTFAAPSLRWRWLIALLLLGIVGCGGAPPTPTPVPPTAEPEPTSDASAPQEQLPTVPPGFKISVAYDGLDLPTTLATDGKHFYVTEFQTGKVKRLTDTNGDGTFDEVITVADGFKFPRGIAFEPKTGDLFIAALGQIHRLHDANGDGIADTNTVVIPDLYYVDASHANNGIAFGPDGKLYITEGQPRQNQSEIKNGKVFFKGKELPERAGTILVANPDGTDVQVYAKGFRNPYDLIFAPDGTLYATENGEDLKQGKPEGDELNRIVKGGDYGFPFILGNPPPDSKTTAPLIAFPQASSPDGLALYQADRFPEKYRNSIFIALFSDPRKVVRAWQDQATGKWQYEDFITNMNRPIDLAVGADGALYIADMNSGQGRNTADPNNPAVIYRVDIQ